MFGRKENKGPDLGQIQQAVQSAANTPGVRNLSAVPRDGSVEIHGVAETIAAKQSAMRAQLQTQDCH